MKDYQLMPHTADIKLRVWGETREQLFVNALKGMFESIAPKVRQCSKKAEDRACNKLIERTIEIESLDIETLLVDFLSEALYLSDVYNEAYVDADINRLTDTTIRAKIKGIKIEGFEVVEIKAVTYHDLQVTYNDGMWQADVVFDI